MNNESIINNIFVVQKGSELYRYTDKEYPLGMTPNKGKDGRFNKYRDVYYCCCSKEDIEFERGDDNPLNPNGRIIKSVVEEPLVLYRPINECLLRILRARVNENPELVHKEVFQPLGIDLELPDYDITSLLLEGIVKTYGCDGIIYPSRHDITIVKGGIVYYAADEEDNTQRNNGYTNIALTMQGYNKIREYAVKRITDDVRIRQANEHSLFLHNT